MTDTASTTPAAAAGPAERLAARVRSFQRRHPLLARRLRLAWTAWTWLALVLSVAALALVPSLRTGARPWLWCYYILVVWFLLARTKTLTWRLVAWTFTGACLLAPLIGLTEVAVAGLAGVDIGRQDGAVLVAGPVEETLKLLPLALVWLLARGRARRMGVADHLLLGLTAGLGFQAVEDAIRRLAVAARPGGLAGLFAALLGIDPDNPTSGFAQYGFELLPGWSNQDGAAFFGGHHVLTALVAAGIGLAVRGRARWGARVWLLPAGLLVMVVVDHALYNHSGTVELAADPHAIQVPGWLTGAWGLWGNGALQRPLLFVLLGVALVADARRVHRVSPVLPPVPEVRWTALPERWAWDLSVRIGRAVPEDATPMVRRASAAVAGATASAGLTVTVLLHELALLVAAAAVPDDQGGTVPRRRRWVRTIGYLRRRRELGQELGATVDGQVAGEPRAGLAAAAATVLPLLLAAVTAALLLGPGAGGPTGGFLANLFDELARWWEGLQPWQQIAAVALLAGLLTLGGMGFLPALGLAGTATSALAHGHGAADFLRDPAKATRSFVTNLTPGQLLGYLAEAAVGRLAPAAFGGVVGGGLRRELDEILDLAGDPAALRRYIALRRAELAALHGDETGAIRFIREDDDFFAPRNARGQLKAHLDPDSGDLLPAAPGGDASVVAHLTNPAAKSRSPYISFSEAEEGMVTGRFGRRRIELDLEALEADIRAGRVHGVEVLRHARIQEELRAQVGAVAEVDVDRALSGSLSQMQRYVAGFRHDLPRDQFLRLNRLMHAIHFHDRARELLVKGVIPARYLTGPEP